MQARQTAPAPPAEIIDDLRHPPPRATNGNAWELVSDRVMGGVSSGRLARDVIDGRTALRLSGAVRLDNNGGFLQAALDLAPGGCTFDASGWQGLRLRVHGNHARYNLHLRSADLDRPWQSYRAGFIAPPAWTELHLPFTEFTAHRTEATLDLTGLRRIGVVAIGRAFEADIAISDIRFYGG